MDMTEPQVWTLIGVFTAIMLGGMTLMTTLLTKTVEARFDGLRGEMTGLRGEMNARFDSVNSRLEKIEHTVDRLDDEVSGLAKRMWGS
ncbi:MULTISPECIES: hypothetical protein [unclassified Microbacterium]|uniref:hypothetical protein n=1 Tax=unclassified Microbacterium TaxID=2609290 RepID=UPI003018224C